MIFAHSLGAPATRRQIVRGRRAALGTLFCATALSTALASSPAMAQEDQSAGYDTEDAIIVTAQRRSERLEDVPMSVSVINNETLAATGVTTVRDLTNVTTGFQVGNTGSTPQPSLRGVTTINPGFYENNVALYVDGLYQSTAQILNMDLPNVENIQILKGPQGTLYGRNATGGAILVDTVDPGNSWEGTAEVTYARFDDKRARGYIAGPLTDGVGLSLAGTIRRTDGYFKIASRTTPGEFDGRGLGLKQDSIRAKLKFDLTDTFTATAGYGFLRSSDPRGMVFTPIENVRQPYTTPGLDTRGRNLGEVSGDIFEIETKQHDGFLKLELETGLGDLRSATGYSVNKTAQSYDFGGAYLQDFLNTFTTRDRVWQSSLDYNIDVIDGLDLIVGGNYFNITTRYADGLSLTLSGDGSPGRTPFSFDNYNLSNAKDFTREKESWAAFADATLHVTDRLSLNVGARYTEETQNVAAAVFFYNTATGELTSNPYTLESTARSSKYSKFTPRASVRYEITPRTNVYASYSKGFRSGEWINEPPNGNPDLWTDTNPETIDAFEVGLKSAGRRLRLDLAGFYYDYKDLQVSFTSQVNGQPVVFLQNAPKAKIYGAEANADFSATDTLNLRAGVTYLHARYGEGFVFTGSGVNPSVAGFVPNPDPLKTFGNTTVSQNLSGLHMSRAPDWTAFAGFDYTYESDMGEFVLAANVKYTSKYIVTNPSVWGGDPTYTGAPGTLPDNTVLLAGTPYVGRASEQRATQNGYALLNGSLTWTDPSDTFYARIFANNLTNKIYRIHRNPIFFGTYQPIGEPRTFGVTLGVKFNGI